MLIVYIVELIECSLIADLKQNHASNYQSKSFVDKHLLPSDRATIGQGPYS